MSWNDLELRHRGKFSYRARDDACAGAPKGQWASTKLVVDVDKPARLPVVDMELRDIGDRDQKFRLTLGPVCFA